MKAEQVCPDDRAAHFVAQIQRKQAVAIAYAVQREAGKKKKSK
jgi:hypothetical protein